ncbi:MAG: transposase [Rhodospirillaceae bacterium]|jgi:putative transposase|nr:transposase [Rhodospirillaceae bacterium]MBT3884591.1 transposase [Rhodospirillaceae bacterium]MBT4117894.1 transposase [Rhodospirillaceae bacterium]MBT4674089.1 transposase [Rhodospirillaceae bacterium]MBT4718166.1 transposase [Rhodospirillaceae bacterium]
MSRIARAVIPGIPHHVTQRGNRRLETFFSDDDYRLYIDLLAESCQRSGTEIWGYCLMPNHVHLIMVPADADGLRASLGEAHRRYARAINQREDWRGHLWQERFQSFPMDEAHLAAAARYVELNPVRARLSKRAENWSWSSARAHLEGRDDGLCNVAPLLERCGDWKALLASGLDDEDHKTIQRHARSGRALGSEKFLTRMETVLGRPIRHQKRGRKPKADKK